MDKAEQIKQMAADHLEAAEPSAPGKLGAPNWKGVLDGLDGFLQSNSAIIGTLTPPQLEVFAQAIIQGIHLVDTAVNRRPAPVVNPNA